MEKQITPSEAFQTIDKLVSEMRFNRQETIYIDKCLSVLHEAIQEKPKPK